MIKNLLANEGDFFFFPVRFKRCWFHPWVEKVPWRIAWQSTSVLLPGESHGQRSHMGYSPQGPKSRTGLSTVSQVACQDEDGTGFGFKVKVAQWCPTLCDPMGYTVHGIFQARILEWVAFPCSRGSSQPRDRTQISRIAGGFKTS